MIRLFAILGLALSLGACMQRQAADTQPTSVPTQASPTPQATATRTRRPTITPTSTPSITPTRPTSTSYPPTPTSPPVPPLKAHTWHPEQVLIQFGSVGGDGGDTRPFELTLLGDRQLYVFEYSPDLRQYLRYEATLSRPETCQLLNTIDQNGWFEFDTELFNYDPAFGPSEGGPSYIVDVNAWSTQRVHYPYLAPFVYEGDILDHYETCERCGAPPPVVPALSSTFTLLDSFRPESLQLAEDAAILVSVRDASWVDDTNDVEEWPEDLFSLAETWEVSACDFRAYRPFTGQEAQTIKDFFERYAGEIFLDEEGVFQVDYVDVIPAAVYSTCGDSSYEPVGYLLPNLHRNLTCSPVDGVLPSP
jgi:hypothetical protein